MTIRVAIVGFGKIARDEHLPAITADARFQLTAVVTRGADPAIGVPCFESLTALLAGMPGQVDAVAICTPPVARGALAREAIAAGLGVLLEKPPAATLGEAAELGQLARAAGVPLYASWHSQHSPGVAAAAEALAGEELANLRIIWREDVRKFHPGQQWIWQPGGFGVFDPGINALSIAERIVTGPLIVAEAQLQVPANVQTPIAATLRFVGADLSAEFDWRADCQEDWSIVATTVSGRTVALREGGATLFIDGQQQVLSGLHGYPSIYDRFAAIMTAGEIDLDLEPLRIVSDAFLVGRREMIGVFETDDLGGKARELP